MQQKNKEKKIMFSEEIDDTINGFSVVITFIGVGIFLLLNKDYFGNQIVNTTIQWIFIIIGCLGFTTEISKINKNKGIKGIEDLILGIAMVAIWAIIYYFVKNWVGNLIGFCFFVIGAYGACRGIMEMIYSMICIGRKYKEIQKSGIKTVREIIFILSEIATVGLLIIQILQAIKVI